MRATTPTFRALSRNECDALLARNHVGRLAFAFRDRLDVQPIHYVYEAGWLFGRTSEGAKLVTLAHDHSVAFEVDEVRGVFDWASVIVHGSFHRISPEDSPRDQAAAARAVHLLRQVVPKAFAADDPTPFRSVLFRIAIGEMTGRIAIPPGVTAADSPAPAAELPQRGTPEPSPPPDPSGW